MRARPTLFAILLVAAAVVAAWAIQTSPRFSGRHSLVVVESRQMMSALLFVAQADGLFEQVGLDVTFRVVPNGRAAMTAMLDGQADLSLSSDVPAANAIATRTPVRILATVETSDRDVAIVSPAGHGLDRPDLLAGKRIGYVPGTNSEHFLTLILRQAGIADQVNCVPFESDTLMRALADGKVDAVSAWTTLRINGMEIFPQGLDTISVAGLYTESWVLSSRKEVVEARREALERFMTALLAAEQVILHDRDHAIPIVAKATGINPSLVQRHWENYGFTLRLDQALLLSLEGHIRNAGGSPGPEMLEFLQMDLLKLADASRVTVLD